MKLNPIFIIIFDILYLTNEKIEVKRLEQKYFSYYIRQSKYYNIFIKENLKYTSTTTIPRTFYSVN